MSRASSVALMTSIRSAPVSSAQYRTYSRTGTFVSPAASSAVSTSITSHPLDELLLDVIVRFLVVEENKPARFGAYGRAARRGWEPHMSTPLYKLKAEFF